MISEVTPTTDRHFLWRWFHVLEKRLLLSDRHALDAHNVRVEASGTSDWWIQVQPPLYERCHGCGFYASHQEPSGAEKEAQLRELREALVLLTMYARIDYDAWLLELKNTSGLRFHKIESLLARFSFVVSGSSHADGSYPFELLAKVFGEAAPQYSEVFMESYELIKAQADRFHTPIEAPLAAIPVRWEFSQFTVSPKRGADSLCGGSNAVTAVRDNTSSVSPFPAFDLDCVELRLRRHELNATTLASISSIMDSGVQIKFLELPGRLEEPVDRQGLHAAWRILARKLFQSASDHVTTGKPQIERLELPPVYFTTDLAASWLPLLVTATNVRSLKIEGGVGGAEPAQSRALSLAWVYLAYALFSKDANHSVESLQLCGVRDVGTDVTESMVSVAGSVTPRLALWQTLAQHPHAIHHGLQSPPTARDDELTGVEQKATDASRCSKLRRLVLSLSPAQDADGEPALVFAFITAVLRLGGRNLTDLAVDGAQINDSTLRKCIALCPGLENLRVSTAVLDSMQAFLGTSSSPISSKLSSLDLRSIHTSESVVNEFLKKLADGSTTTNPTLDRLRIGQGWSGHLGASTPHILSEMLTRNHSLSFLHVFRPNDMFVATPSSSWDKLKDYDGNLIASRDRPLAMDRKLAFLASSKGLSEKSLLPPLNHDVLAHIFQFAATPRRRTVIVEADRSSSYM